MIYFIYPNVDIWDYIVDGIKDKDVVARPLNPNCYKWQMAIRKLLNNKKLPSWCLFGRQMVKELKTLQAGDTVLIADYIDVCLFKSISSLVKPDVKKCLWSWNPIHDDEIDRFKKAFEAIRTVGFELSTFDKKDAERFNQQLFSQFFRMYPDDVKKAKDRFREVKNDKECCDFYFIGYEKNRGKLISELEDRLKDYRTCFKLVHNDSECVPYSQNMENIKRTKCIIEIVQEGQTGITLRPLEALSMQKKLMTNNCNIKQYDLYTSENIFIIGEDSYDRLDDFISTPFKVIVKNIIDQYDISTWFSHFKNI